MCKPTNYTNQIIEKKPNERNRMDIKTSNKFFYDKIGEVHQRDGGMLIGINFP